MKFNTFGLCDRKNDLGLSDRNEGGHSFEQFQQEVEDAKIAKIARQQQAMGKLVGVFTARQLKDMMDNGEI